MFPRLLLLQSKSLRPLLTGEFVGRSSKTQREMRKQWILSGVANSPIQPKNQPQNEKADQRSGQRRIFKMVDHFFIFQKNSLHLKMANFSSLKRRSIFTSRKILREKLELHSASKKSLNIAKMVEKRFELPTSTHDLSYEKIRLADCHKIPIFF